VLLDENPILDRRVVPGVGTMLASCPRDTRGVAIALAAVASIPFSFDRRRGELRFAQSHTASTRPNSRVPRRLYRPQLLNT